MTDFAMCRPERRFGDPEHGGAPGRLMIDIPPRRV
jgi:hypothetical protein